MDDGPWRTRWRRGLCAGLLAIALAGGAAAAEPGAPIVATRSGAVAGARTDGVEAFRAIPYAQPPVGDLRWRPPQPPRAWRGVRPATTPGHICVQPASTKIPGVQSEDCLTLDVFTAARGAGKPAPVLVWIHGGGFTGGTGVTPEVDGRAFAESGVVLVNINYRLGRLGFFAHPALTKEAGGRPGANFGLMDQIAALKWVRANIAAFGGDPRQVTIAGGSAGGASVLALMISPPARGLFHRAVVQSGLGRERTLDLAGAERLGAALAARWGAPAASGPKALRAAPVERILAAEDADSNFGVLNGEFPIIDGWVMPTSTLAAFEAGREARVPLLIGAMELEVPPGVQPSILKARIPAYDRLPADLKAVYPDPDRYAALLPSDVIFVEPSVKLAALHASRAPTWVYRFGVAAETLQKMLGGAVHGTEGPYVFRTYDVSAIPIEPRARAAGEAVHAYWAAFVRNGDPNGAGRPAWPRFAADRIMTFTNAGPRPGRDPAADRLKAVGAALEAGRLPRLVEPRSAAAAPD
ncbi:carboxylesterase family protein [Phenylobacterium sp.]|uniref:carboxylesterase/lipase family protein n=1 Tax=Phenylobacterium sp. TaxID=1871053 RepID=UPI0025EE4569|nr:carboxylesterase family protein [Phenylobacterium sp.]MBX3484706.1 carboxylesterase family protein [Phenylobacterium sp.]